MQLLQQTLEEPSLAFALTGQMSTSLRALERLKVLVGSGLTDRAVE
jgi:hypothetical protein